MPRPRTISLYLLVYDTGGASTDRASFGQRLLNLHTFVARAAQIAGANMPGHGGGHLNLFMAPEFYLNRGIEALTQTQWTQMVGQLSRLSNGHQGWMIIPGTALWGHQYSTAGQRRLNTAPVFYNGHLVHAYCKRYPGDTEPGGHAWAVEYPLASVPSDPVFAVEGIYFGIEICNDYRVGAFKTYFDKTWGAANGPGRPPWMATYNQKPGVDVQLLPSNGVTPMEVRSYPTATVAQANIYFDHARVRPDGYFAVSEGALPANQTRAVYHRKTVVYKRTRGGIAPNGPRPAEAIISPRDSSTYLLKGFYPVPGDLDNTPAHLGAPSAPMMTCLNLSLPLAAP